MAESVNASGRELWAPTPERQQASRLWQYMRWLEREHGLRFDDYSALWRWSVTEIEAFWGSLWDYFELGERHHTSVLDRRTMPGAHWFAGATLNYAERALAQRSQRVAIIHRGEDGIRRQYSFAELADAVARCRAGLERLGVRRGDRVVGYVQNGPEAVIALLASASLGAIWSSCPPEFGTTSVLDRFAQIEPKVLFAARRYTYGGKRFDRSDAVRELRAALPSLAACVFVDGLPETGAGALSFGELLAAPAELRFEPLPFEHPLWILFSSGTTGLPKAIVHGHGGMVLEHLKVLALHSDLGPGSRFFWFSTTGWMMWNYLVSGLLVGATIVLYDGSPAHPDLGALWRLAAEERVTYFGTSAPFLMACRSAQIVPKEVADLSAITAVGSTGAPLPAEGFEWVYEAVGSELLLGSVSGGTDLCTAFVLSCPILPVHSGELQCRGLGANVQAFDAQGKPLEDAVGELVITAPMPCMPLFFWNDPAGVRYRESYFEQFPGVWRHGDWLRLTPSGGAQISGRSDSTLNRGGVRMGTSEFYRVVEELPAVKDSVVIDTTAGDGAGKLWLFLVLNPGHVLDAELTQALKQTLRTRLSPRHVPDELRVIPEVPRTLSGKKLEVPIKRLLAGARLVEVVAPGTLQNPQALNALLDAAGVPPER
jgi:acetoacetyl-CoA synthetase